MEPSPDVLRRIPGVAQAAAVTRIAAGYSEDAKYLVLAADGSKALLRIGAEDADRRRRDQVGLLRELRSLGARVPTPLAAGRLDDPPCSYCLLSYVEGRPAAAALPAHRDDVQYRIGVQAGGDLRRMHRLEAPPAIRPWNDRAVQKHRRNLAAYRRCGIRVEGEDEVTALVEANVNALRGRPNRFQHDDFHTANIIVRRGRYAGTIDFDRHDWGDPFHEFRKLGFFSRGVSVPFCLGQIDGYFRHRGLPEGFWRLYAVYMAMTVISSVVWAVRFTPDGVQEMLDLVSLVIDDHSGFQCMTPRWYAASSR